MAYNVEDDGSIVIEGWEKGIAKSPYNGISDMRNVNIISVPGEASVSFSTSKISSSSVTGSITSADASADTILISGQSIEQGQAVTFSGGSLPGGIVAGTPYWAIPVGGGNYNLYTNSSATSLLNITSTGTGTYASIDIASPKHFTFDGSNYWMIDSSGRVWSNVNITINGNWVYTGNLPNNNSHGNGLVNYQASDGTKYIFAFSDSSIDYATLSGVTITWVYQWNISSGTVGAWSATPTQRLKTANGTNNTHKAIIAPDNKVYFCDANWIGRFYQASPTSAFVPTTLATYVFDQTSVLPFTDIAQSLAPSGNNLLVGGQKNIIYPWDTFSQLPSFPIIIAESNISELVTVNTNTYIFAGNRGRIYVTNGAQANLFKKVPDHISGTVEPYFTWGGATSNKNQLYFSFSSTTNSGTSLSQYGGVWAIDLETEAIRLTNKLSFNTYLGIASTMIPNFSSAPAGTGLYLGWYDGVSAYGIDTTSSNPYTSSQAVIETDLIPIGTFDKPKDFTRVEYKLTKPMVSGESVTIKYRLDFSQSYSDLLTDSTVGNFSLSGPISFKNAQWVQFQVILNSTNSSPSYTRLKNIRIK